MHSEKNNLARTRKLNLLTSKQKQAKDILSDIELLNEDKRLKGDSYEKNLIQRKIDKKEELFSELIKEIEKIEDSINNNQIEDDLNDISQVSNSIAATNSDEGVKEQKESFWQSKTVQKVGFVGSLASIIGLLIVFLPLNSNDLLQLTVFVTDRKGNVVLQGEGKLNIPLGNNALNAYIGENGRTNFGDISTSFKGEEITIGLEAKGWEIADGQNTFTFTGKPIRLKVKRDNSLGIIKGVVKSRDGQTFISGALVRINTDTTILTDEFGVFKIVLPTQMQVENKNDGYLLTVTKDEYQTKTQYHFPNSSDAEVRIDKN